MTLTEMRYIVALARERHFGRAAEACYKSSSLAVALAKKHGTRLHVLHISTARELELFEDKPLADKHITAEVCVHHLLFDDRDYARLGSHLKCNPAVKTQADRDALRAALNSHRLDVIGTDHAPRAGAEPGPTGRPAPPAWPGHGNTARARGGRRNPPANPRDAGRHWCGRGRDRAPG